MFAVTQEDFVHPMAVIELLWRSCCALDAEKEQEESLATRLKVRQWTQMLVDHSLLLGSSSEGIHLHDIVLQYLRKRLSAEELRSLQRKLVDGMVAAGAARIKESGRGFEDTGTSDKVSGLPQKALMDGSNHVHFLSLRTKPDRPPAFRWRGGEWAPHSCPDRRDFGLV